MWRVLPYAFAVLVALAAVAIVKTSTAKFVDHLRGNGVEANRFSTSHDGEVHW